MRIAQVVNMGSGKCRFTVSQKIEIYKEAYESGSGVKATARKYNVSPGNIRRWRKLLTVTGSSLTLHRITSGPRRPLPQVFEHLEEFFDALRGREQSVTIKLLVFEAMRCFSDVLSGVARPALYQRIYRWLKAKRISHRRVTHIAQNTRISESLCSEWVSSVNCTIREMGVVPKMVINMDETNFDFDDSRSVTLERVGTRTVSLRSTKSCKRATVILAVTLSGEKLPPFVIFAGKRKARIHRQVTVQAAERGFPGDVLYSVQENAWNNGEVMQEWLKRVYEPWCRGSQSVLLMDDFSGHWVPEAVNYMESINCKTILIPKGHTSKLQVLDVGMNKPFRDYTLDLIDEWMLQAYDKETGRIPNPDRLTIAHRVSESWSRMSHETINNTWRHIGIICPVVVLAEEVQAFGPSPLVVGVVINQ